MQRVWDGEGRNTYAAEKVPDEDDQLAGSDAFAGIEFFELARLAVGVEDEEFACAGEVCGSGEVVVNVDVAGEVEVWGLLFEGWGWG